MARPSPVCNRRVWNLRALLFLAPVSLVLLHASTWTTDAGPLPPVPQSASAKLSDQSQPASAKPAKNRTSMQQPPTVQQQPPIRMEPVVPPAMTAASQEATSGDPRENEAAQDVLSPDAVREGADFQRAREEWFLEARRLPDGSVGARKRLEAIEHVDRMIIEQRRMGVIPSADAVPPVTNFPGPTTWTNLGPRPINVPATGFPFNGGPQNSGRMGAIAVDPTNPNIVYVGGAAGGVWKTVDAGVNWTPLTDQQPSLSTGSIAVDPTFASCGATGPCQIIYVGTGEQHNSADSYYGAGVLKSTDGGNNWTQLGASTFVPGPGISARVDGAFHIGAIAVDPSDSQIVLAGAARVSDSTASGIFRSINGGTDWTLVRGGAAGTSIVFDPNTSGIVYAALGQSTADADNGVYRSTDHGATWTEMTGSVANPFPTSGVGRIELGFSRSAPTTLLALIANSNSASLRGLFKTTNANLAATADWIRQTSAPDFCTFTIDLIIIQISVSQCFYDLAIKMDPTDANFVFAGGSTDPTSNLRALWRSTNGGANWTSVANGANGVGLHVDLQALAYSADGSKLYIGNDGGMWRTDDPRSLGTPSYTNLNGTLTVTMSYPGRAHHPSDENIMFVGTQDNGTQRYSGPLGWDLVTGGDGAQNDFDRKIPSTVYTACQQTCIFRSLTDGTTAGSFTVEETGIASSSRTRFIPPLTADPNNANIVYWANFQVYQSRNAGSRWRAISPDLNPSVGAISALAVAPSDSNTVYAGIPTTTSSATQTGSRIWKTNSSLSANPTWVQITPSGASAFPPRNISGIAVDQNDANLIYVSFNGFRVGADTQGHVFRSPDGGTTWEDISGTGLTALPNLPHLDIVADPEVPNTLFVANDIGVFRTANANAGAGTIWSPFGTGLPRVVVNSLTLRRQSRSLAARTSGRGTWVIQLTDIPVPSGPFVSSIRPASVNSGSPNLTLTDVDGANFTGTSMVRFNGTPIATTLVSANKLTATIPAASLTTPGVFNIDVIDGAATSDALPFAVKGVSQSISVSPTSSLVNTAFTLTVNRVSGPDWVCSGPDGPTTITFVNGSNGFLHNPDTCTASQITVNIPAAETATTGSSPVFAFTPLPGVGESNTASVNVTPPPPPNDNFAAAIVATAPPNFSNTQDTRGATTEPGEPVPPGACSAGQSATTRSIWYSFMPTTNGTVNANTNGSNYNTIIQAVTGSLNIFAPVACGNTSSGSGGDSVSFAATAGTTYFFMVSSFNGLGGTTSIFNLSFAAPVTFNPASVAFVNQTVNTTSADTTVTLTNTGAATLNVTSITKTGTDPTQFNLITSPTAPFTCPAGANALAVNASCTFGVNFAPTTVSAKSANIAVASDAAGSPHNLSLTGTGVAASTPDLTITKTHAGNFTVGVNGTYTITVTNSGNAPTTGAVTLTDTIPTELVALSLTGTGWNCTVAPLSCTRSDALAASSSYPPITLQVSVSPAAFPSVSNVASVTGGGETNTTNNSASDPTTVTRVDLTIAKTHTGNFTVGVNGSYTITVSNTGNAASSGTVTVTDTLPIEMVALSLTGTGWNCTLGTLTCTRADALAPSSPYPAITLTVNPTATGSVTNTVTVSGGNDAVAGNNSASDPTTIVATADLVVTKIDSADPVVVGQQFTYTVTITNNGPSPATSVSLSDSLTPTTFSFGTITPSQGTCTPLADGSITCSLGTINNGANATVIVPVTPNAPGTLTNTVSATTTATDPNPANNTNIVQTTTVNAAPAPDLTITKTHTGNFTVGVNGSYTITVTNSGNAPTTGTVTMTDTIPTEMVALSLTGTGWNCTLAPLSCNRADALAASSSYSAITLTVNPITPGQVTNTATVAGGGEANTTNNTANDPTTIIASVDLAITKTDLPDPIDVGQTLTYTLTVTNNGPNNLNGTISLADTLPANVTFLNAVGNGWACAPPSGGVVTCTRPGILAANTSAPVITLTVSVNVAAAGTTLTNQATVSTTAANDPTPGNNSATAQTAVNPAADVSVTKNDSPDPIAVGSNLTYTITVTNNGPSAAAGVTLTDALPANVAFVSATSTVGVCAEAAGTVTCDIGALANGASAVVTIVITPQAPAVGIISNTATATATTFDHLPGNNSDTETTTVQPSADLAVTKADSPDPINVGQNLTYTVVVTNNGPNTASGVSLSDPLPAGVAFVSANSTVGTCSQAAGTVTCAIGSLASGASAAITIVVTVQPGPGRTLPNTATASATGSSDPVPGNDSGTATTTVNPNADLAVSKSDSPDPVTVGSNLTYTVTVTNQGPDPAASVTVTDTLPAGVTFVSANSTVGACAENAGIVTCNIGALANGGTAIITIIVTPTVPATLSNTASAATTTFDPVAANNSTTITTTARLVTDLSLTKTDNPDPILAGQNLTYTVTVSNGGPHNATGVTLTDTLPANVTFVSANSTAGTCAQAAGVVTCNIGALANGASATVTIIVTTTGATAASITNTANVTGAEFDSNAANNSASASTAVTPVADVQIIKTAAPNPVNAGQNLTYAVNVRNNGPSAATGISVTDTPPVTLALVSATGSQGTCSIAAGTITCNVGTLASGAQATATIVVTPLAGAVPSVSNTAAVTANETDPVAANNSSTVVVTVNPAANLIISKTDSPDPVVVSTSLTYTIAVINNGPNSATSVSLTDTLPAGVTFVSVNSTVGACSHAAGTVTCNIGTMANAATATITIVVTAPASTGSITNTASVTAAEFDPSTPNSASQATTVNPVQPPDFSISPSTPAISVPAGLDAIFNVTIGQLGGLTGQVALSCSGNPELSTCTVSPASVTLGPQPASATVTVATRAGAQVPPVAPKPPLGSLRIILALVFAMLALLMLASMARAARKHAWRGAMVRLAALVVWATLAWGCVSGTSGTPPGTYTIIITGTQGNISHSVQVTLIVR